MSARRVYGSGLGGLPRPHKNAAFQNAGSDSEDGIWGATEPRAVAPSGGAASRTSRTAKAATLSTEKTVTRFFPAAVGAAPLCPYPHEHVVAVRPLLIVSDVHLTRGGDTPVTHALANVLECHREHELVLNGDVFNLSTEPLGFDVAEVLTDILRPKSVLVNALRAHLEEGAPITFLAGNHDALLASSEAERALREVLLGGVPSSESLSRGVLSTERRAERLTCKPWFVRRGCVHIEHGHVYDADNAPNHPLIPPSWRTEPLGIAITRRFLVPHRALEFCHLHETTPMAGLRRALELYGPRAPRVVLGYFAYAARQCRSTWHKERLRAEYDAGQGLLRAHAQDQGVDPAALQRLLATFPQPTHHHLRRTFPRLYLDRVVASVGSVGGAAAMVVGAPMSGLLIAGAGTTYLSASLARSRNRYAGIVEQALRDGAERIAEFTGAQTVVMGHTHNEDRTSCYLNTGSFAYPNAQGRPFVRVDEQGGADRVLWLGTEAARAA